MSRIAMRTIRPAGKNVGGHSSRKGLTNARVVVVLDNSGCLVAELLCFGALERGNIVEVE